MGRAFFGLLLLASALTVVVLGNIGACGRGGSSAGITCGQIESLVFLLIANGVGIFITGLIWLVLFIQRKKK